MAISNAADDGFQVVRRRGRHSGYSKPPHNATAQLQPSIMSLKTEDILTRVKGYRESVQTQQFYHEVYDLLTKVNLSFTVVVCYGIGRMGSCPIAQQQFALLLLILEELKPSQSWLYDPVLVEEEREAVHQCGCNLFTTNDMCKYTAKQSTLFYMPHCGQAMYNNLLWANWNPTTLSQIAIIGNCFSSYHERLPEKHFKKALYLYRYKISSRCIEHHLPNCYPDTTVFNDLALHTFPLDTLTTLSQDVWTNCPEPQLDPLDLEIISTPQ